MFPRGAAGQTYGTVRLLLQLEALSVALAAIAAYAITGGSWLLFALLILAPDLSLLGVALGRERGVLAYNVAHSYVWPVALMAIGYFLTIPMLTSIALIWIVHIAGDRAIGFGLKYPTGQQHTHLARKGD